MSSPRVSDREVDRCHDRHHAPNPAVVPNTAPDTVDAVTGTQPRIGDVLRRLAIPVYLPVIAGTLGVALIIPVLPLYLTRSGLSLEAAAVVLAALGAGATIGGLPAGAMITRFGERTVMIGALLGLSITAALLGVSEAALVLVALRLGAGASNISLRLSRQTYITRRIETVARGRAMAMIGGSFRVSLFVGPLVGGVLAETIGFTWTFVAAGALSAVGLVPAMLSGGGESVPVPSPSASAERPGLFAAINQHRRLLSIAGVVPMLTMAVREGRYVVVPLIGDELGLSVAEVGALVAVGTFADLVLFPLAGFVMDRFGRLAAMIPSFSLIAIGLVILGMAESTGAAIIAGVIMGVGNGLSSGSMLTLGSDLAPRREPAPFLSAIAVIQDIGKVIGPLVVGFVGAAAGLSASAIVLALLMIAVIVWLLAVVGETSAAHPRAIRSSAVNNAVRKG
jgi:MFS family permease